MFGTPLQHLGETGSTNDVAAQWAREGTPHGAVVRADEQSHGRGRLGRAWASPAGLGLYFSVVLRPESLTLDRVPQLTMLASLASADAIEELSGLRAAVKWPNDIILHDRKIGGVLSEATAREGTNEVDFAIVGIGLNVNFRAEDLPSNVKIPATSLRMETGDLASCDGLLNATLRALEANYNRFVAGEWPQLRDEFIRRDILQDQWVLVETARETYRGQVCGLNEAGIIQVRTETGFNTVVAGDVRLEQ